MTHLGIVLGWKFNYEPGISTRDGKITAWPASLGPHPTAAQIATWTAELDAIIAADADHDAKHAKAREAWIDEQMAKRAAEPSAPKALKDWLPVRRRP